MLRFLPSTSQITCPATNQVVRGCETLWQLAERSSTFYNKFCTCSVFYRPRANLFVASDEKLRKKGQEKCATCFAAILQKELKSDVLRLTSHESNTNQIAAGCRNFSRGIVLFFATTFSNMQKLNLFQERFDSRMVKPATSPLIRFSVMLQSNSELKVFVARFTRPTFMPFLEQIRLFQVA